MFAAVDRPYEHRWDQDPRGKDDRLSRNDLDFLFATLAKQGQPLRIGSTAYWWDASSGVLAVGNDAAGEHELCLTGDQPIEIAELSARVRGRLPDYAEYRAAITARERSHDWMERFQAIDEYAGAKLDELRSYRDTLTFLHDHEPADFQETVHKLSAADNHLLQPIGLTARQATELVGNDGQDYAGLLRRLDEAIDATQRAYVRSERRLERDVTARTLATTEMAHDHTATLVFDISRALSEHRFNRPADHIATALATAGGPMLTPDERNRLDALAHDNLLEANALATLIDGTHTEIAEYLDAMEEVQATLQQERGSEKLAEHVREIYDASECDLHPKMVERLITLVAEGRINARIVLQDIREMSSLVERDPQAYAFLRDRLSREIELALGHDHGYALDGYSRSHGLGAPSA